MTRLPLTQEQFNVAYLGLHAQGFRQSRRGDACVYRGPDNCRCAVGHLIPNSDYRSELDRGGGIFVGEIEGYVSAIDIDDLMALQNCHDEAASPADMQERLAAFATERGFTIPNLEPVA